MNNPDSTGDVPFTCPNCEVRGTMDEDQGRGEQSIICPECGWHGRIHPNGGFEVGEPGDPDKNPRTHRQRQIDEIDQIIQAASNGR